jgi:hypothetical protein
MAPDTNRVAVFNCYNSLWQQWHPLATERPVVTAVSREEILKLPPKRRSLFRSPWEDCHVTNEAQFEAHRLLSSTAGARPGAARASRSPVRPAGPADFWLLEHRMPLSLCVCAKVLPHVAAFIAAMSPAAPVSGPQHAPWAGLAFVEHLHRERFVTGLAGARRAFAI